MQKKDIPHKYWFAAYNKRTDAWSPAIPENRKARVLISQEWAENNLPKFTDNQDGYKYKPLPPLLTGDVHEMEVEVRGELTREGIRFKCKDVARLFDMPSLEKNISKLLESSFYEVFYTEGSTRVAYFTYHGIIKVISTRSYNISNVTKFMNTPLMKELQQQSQNMVVIMPCKEQQTIQAIQEALLNVMSTIIKTGIDLMNMKKDRSVSY